MKTARGPIAHFASVLFIAATGMAPMLAADVAQPADLISDDVTFAVTLRDGARRVTDFRDCATLRRFLDSPQFRELQTKPEFLKAQGAMLLFAGGQNMDPWTVASQVLGRELTFALTRHRGEPTTVVVAMSAADLDATSRLFDTLLALSGATDGGEPVSGRATVADDVHCYTLAASAAIASFDGFVAFSNRAAALERLVERRKSSDGKLTNSAEFRNAANAVPPGAVAWAYVNIRRIRDLAGAEADVKLDSFLGAMLLGGVVDALRSAESAVLWLEADEGALTVRGTLFGANHVPLKPFRVDSEVAGDWLCFDIPGLIGSVELARDWTAFWDAREVLMNTDGLRGLNEFAGTLTTLLGSLDFSSELLPQLRPSMRILAARQEFHGPAPTPELPGFALLVHLKDAARIGRRLEQGALTAMSILNLDMGQKMLPQFNIGLDQHAGAKMIVAMYPEDLDPGMRGIRYNFAPAIAIVGDRFVIATSRKTLTDIIDALARMPESRPADRPKDDSAAADSLRVDLRELIKLLDANREVFVTNRMLEEDLTRETAASQVAMFLDVAKALKDLTVELRPAKTGYSLRARIGLTP